MKKLRGFCFLGILFFIISSSCGPQEPERVRVSYGLMNAFIQEAKGRYGFRPFGIGGGFLNNVNELLLSFKKEGIYNVDEARELFILSSQDFLKKINTDEEIRPHLSNYPFTEQNISYTLTFVDERNHGINQENGNKDPNILSYVSWLGKRITYSIYNEETPWYQHIHEESYQEALEKVFSQESSKGLGDS